GQNAPVAPDTKSFGRFPRVRLPRSLGPVDLKVVTRDGKNLVGHYVGLDGTTGLSVIQLSENALPKGIDTLVESIQPGQIVRLIGPEPVLQEGNARRTVYVRVGDTKATVIDVTRRPSQTVARVRVKSPRISSANIGAVAVNTAGTPVGIVNSVEGDEASIVPLGLVRSAVKRVIERQASVPRAWLGVRGEPIGKLQLESIVKVGWQAERARALSEKQLGIFLTSVMPGSPAAYAELKPGDVILSVNNESIKNAEDFSLLLQDALPGSLVNFTVARPGVPDFEAFKIKLAESPDPWFGYGFGSFTWPTFKPLASGLMRGTQTIALKPKVALRLGANGGLLVVYVQPNTAAFAAGLRAGDVIESVNGEAVVTRSPAGLLDQKETTTIVVVRDKKRLTITVPAEKK
ncbi:MAG TPA: PDZ domain-containing protein, partial [Pyrinomonadaceae bacterium]|nr:PDZ domain-containing protein [Pyrinomonadaceae bacterium]